MSDSDFPTELNNAEKQINKAKELASQHLGIKAISAQLTTTQGCFSKTLEVFLQDGRSVIIQFRIEALDAEPFLRARDLLGDIVPIIEVIHDPELVKAGNETRRATCSKSLGRVFARCFVEGNTSEVVDSDIIPNLHTIRALALERDDVKPFSAFIAKLIEEAPTLKKNSLYSLGSSI
ncbi:hypothetical protein VE02_07843 [Pseudogymnoascus sp. 03VT05]|nr:hypothetical protein VE02_07843 [Pseudogymnoascus sp. 03VT05]